MFSPPLTAGMMGADEGAKMLENAAMVRERIPMGRGGSGEVRGGRVLVGGGTIDEVQRGGFCF